MDNLNCREKLNDGERRALDASKVFSIKVQYGDCDVVAKQSNDVGWQRQQVKEPRIVNSVVSATERVSNEMRRCILINRL